MSLNSFRKSSVTSYSVVKMGNQINVLSLEKKRSFMEVWVTNLDSICTGMQWAVSSRAVSLLAYSLAAA